MSDAVRRVPVFAACAVTAGCATRVIPPPSPAEPVGVFVADYGLHSSLVLPAALRGDGSTGAVVYAYGEWEWYALGNEAWWRAPGVVLLPNPGALGRREVGATPHAETLLLALGAAGIAEATVERERAGALLRDLDARWEARAETRVRNSRVGLDFVRDERDYWMFHHCNTQTAEWLEALGCRVSGVTIGSTFVIFTSALPRPGDP